jgi:hypothetical protein
MARTQMFDPPGKPLPPKEEKDTKQAAANDGYVDAGSSGGDGDAEGSGSDGD